MRTQVLWKRDRCIVTCDSVWVPAPFIRSHFGQELTLGALTSLSAQEKNMVSLCFRDHRENQWDNNCNVAGCYYVRDCWFHLPPFKDVGFLVWGVLWQHPCASLAEMLHLPEFNFFFLRNFTVGQCLLANFFPKGSALGDVKMSFSSPFWRPLYWAPCSRNWGDCFLVWGVLGVALQIMLSYSERLVSVLFI